MHKNELGEFTKHEKEWGHNEYDSKKLLTLQSLAYFLASMIAAFLSRSDSNFNTNDSPFLPCQNSALVAVLRSSRTPHS